MKKKEKLKFIQNVSKYHNPKLAAEECCCKKCLKKLPHNTFEFGLPRQTSSLTTAELQLRGYVGLYERK